MTFVPAQSMLGRFPALLLFLAVFGCGGPSPADPKLVRATLSTVLDAWREGLSLDDVTSSGLANTVSDPAWKAGFKLSRYEIAETARTAGFDLKMSVRLWLLDPKGRNVEQQVRYTVSVDPAKTVIRAPF